VEKSLDAAETIATYNTPSRGSPESARIKRVEQVAAEAFFVVAGAGAQIACQDMREEGLHQ